MLKVILLSTDGSCIVLFKKMAICDRVSYIFCKLDEKEPVLVHQKL